jgi:hypothetical protein
MDGEAAIVFVLNRCENFKFDKFAHMFVVFHHFFDWSLKEHEICDFCIYVLLKLSFQ